jgi:ATP synthase protein I
MTKRPTDPQTKNGFSPESNLGFALRLGTEFISGILVGLLMGYAIDQIWNTQPWGLIIMVILGAAAGMLNIFRLLGIGKPSAQQDSPVEKRRNEDG